MGTRYLTFPRSERIAEVATFSAHVGHKFIHSGMGSPESTLNITADPLPPDESYSLMLTVGVQFGSPMEDDVMAQVKRAGAAKTETAHTTPRVKPVADSGSSMSNNYRVDYIPASTSTATRVYTYIVADPAQQVAVSTQTTEEVCESNGFLGAEILPATSTAHSHVTVHDSQVMYFLPGDSAGGVMSQSCITVRANLLL